MVINVKKLIKNVGDKSYSYRMLNVKKVPNAIKSSTIYLCVQMMI
jgi:hypothetical protein